MSNEKKPEEQQPKPADPFEALAESIKENIGEGVEIDGVGPIVDPLDQPDPSLGTIEDLLKQFSAAPAIESEIAAAQSQAAADAKAIGKGKKKPAKPAPAPAPAPQVKQPHPAHVAAVSSHVRQTIVGVLKTLSPKDYDEYVARKFKGVAHGQRPDLAQSQAAYVWAFERFLQLTYKKSGV